MQSTLSKTVYKGHKKKNIVKTTRQHSTRNLLKSYGIVYFLILHINCFSFTYFNNEDDNGGEKYQYNSHSENGQEGEEGVSHLGLPNFASNILG